MDRKNLRESGYANIIMQISVAEQSRPPANPTNEEDRRMSRRHIRNQAIAWLRRNGEAPYLGGVEPVQIIARLGARRIRITDYAAWARAYGADDHIGEERRTLIDISDLDFDRWANSVVLREAFDPRKPVRAQINALIAEAERLDPPDGRRVARFDDLAISHATRLRDALELLEADA